nr:hypothetical protein [Priestia megaterium]
MIDITAECKQEIDTIKQKLPDETKVKIYIMDYTKFIYCYSENHKTLTILSRSGKVETGGWIHGVTKIMNMKLIDVLMKSYSNGTIVITEKPDNYPKVANCTY